ncbi:hypothetical protein RMS29_026575 (plasmid) [Agrobacterium rosae]|uniref:Uncharacterized protein n=1 Tax=Agrobacterium rosae TaxID=1972867 RepID=A0ABU4W2A2_9HYPH|nr:hypothetical protein [Agrobacterium rosae]MDX8331881.1 hypothetical protein [Agrobacterium rosae]
MSNNSFDSHGDARRQNANWQEALRVNEDIEKRSSKTGTGGNLGFICFVAAIVVLKPAVEYLISLTGEIRGQIHNLLLFFGL